MATRSRSKVCTYCQKTFVKTEHLLRHERSHTGDKPYQCQTCGRRYARRDVLLRHEKVFHGPSNPPADRRGSIRSNQPDNDAATNNRNDTASTMISPGPTFDMEMDRANHSIPSNPHQASLAEGSNSMDMQILGTADLDALATVSMVHAQQESFAMSADASMQAIGHLIDPALSATPRSLSAGMRGAHRASSFTSSAAETSSHVPRAYDTRTTIIETPSLDGGGFDVYNANLFGSIDFSDFDADGGLPMLDGGHVETNFDRTSNIPLERFALVARLWPNNKSRLAEHHRSSIWKEIADFTGDNILTDTSIPKTSPASSLGDREHEFEWSLDEEKRRGLVLSLATTSSAREGTDAEANVPSLKLLNLSLNVVFRQASSLLPFIHLPTFSIKRAPSSIVMPLCLLGMLLLDSAQVRALAARGLPGVTQACCQQFGSASKGRGTGAKTVALLVSGAILLRAWAICPAQNQQHEMLAQNLHMQVISLAKGSSLFTHSHVSSRAEEIVAQVKCAAPATPSNDEGSMWKVWARLESVKRLVSTLVTMDCWWSYSLGHSPVLRANQTRFEQPCPTELYRASSAKLWHRLIHAEHGGPSEQTSTTGVNSPSNSASLRRVSPVGIMGSLSTIWLRVLEVRSQQNTSGGDESNTSLDAQSGLLIQDPPGKEIARMLVQEYSLHAIDFRFRNPNCTALWHFLNINIYADLEIFNKAAGRDGAESAHEALQAIASWSQTADARRACLHAAGIHASMNRRRAKDGVMLHTELCIFSAALVLGLYVFMMASDGDSASNSHTMGQMDDDPYELLDDVTWPLQSDPAFTSSSRSPSMPGGQQESAAERFVRAGGAINFSGILCDGGYNAAKRILLDYASLLEEVSKWDASGLCRILRIMSDSLLEV